MCSDHTDARTISRRLAHNGSGTIRLLENLWHGYLSEVGVGNFELVWVRHMDFREKRCSCQIWPKSRLAVTNHAEKSSLP